MAVSAASDWKVSLALKSSPTKFSGRSSENLEGENQKTNLKLVVLEAKKKLCYMNIDAGFQ